MQRKLEVDFTVYGLRISQAYEGSQLSVVQCTEGGIYLGIPICAADLLRIRYRVPVQADTSLPEQDYVDRVLQEEINLFQHCLSLLLAAPWTVLHSEAKLDGDRVVHKRSPRELRFGLRELAARWSEPLISVPYSSVVQDDGWPLLETLVSEFRQMPTALRQRLELPLRWFAKASNELDSVDRLVAFWISFNALYAYKTAGGEVTQIKSYVTRCVDRTIAERYVRRNEADLRSLSAFVKITVQRGQCHIARQLRKLLATNPLDFKLITTKAAVTVYGVRCRLFHGKCDLAAECDKNQIALSERLLSRLLRELLGREMLGHALSGTDFVKWERFG